MQFRKLRPLLLFGFFALALSACSMEASIQSLVDEINVLKAPGQVHGIATGAVQGQSPTNSTNKYLVSSSVGITGGSSLTSTSLVYTTTSGLKVYSSVQGAIVSK